MVHEPAPEFVGRIGSALAYWRRQAAESAHRRVAELNQERHNLYRVVQFGLALPQTQLASAEVALHAFPLIESQGYWHEWLPVLEQALRVCPEEQMWLRFKLMSRLGQLWRLRMQLSKAIAAHEEALLMAGQMESPITLAEAHFNLAWAYGDAHQEDAAERHAHRALDLLGDSSDEFALELRSWALSALGRANRSRADYATAATFFQQSAAVARRCQNPAPLGEALHDLALTYSLSQRYDLARVAYEEALDIAVATGRLLEQVRIQYEIGVLHFAQRQWARAEAALRQIDMGYLHETGNLAQQTIVLTALGNALLYQGRHADAALYLRQAVALWRLMDDDLELANAVGSLGEVLAPLGQSEEAALLFTEALTILARYPANPKAGRLRDLFSAEQTKLALAKRE
jgi:tetratricopeptide (TPR) repeat protein